MPRLRLLIPALVLCASAAAASPDWSRAKRVEVRLSSFDYAPSTIDLRAGEPVVLHLVNVSSGGHDFAARAFFAAADIRPQDRAAIVNGKVDLEGRQSRDIALVPKAGRYSLKCTHSFHKLLGMSGTIIVS